MTWETLPGDKPFVPGTGTLMGMWHQSAKGGKIYDVDVGLHGAFFWKAPASDRPGVDGVAAVCPKLDRLIACWGWDGVSILNWRYQKSFEWRRANEWEFRNEYAGLVLPKDVDYADLDDGVYVASFTDVVGTNVASQTGLRSDRRKAPCLVLKSGTDVQCWQMFYGERKFQWK